MYKNKEQKNKKKKNTTKAKKKINIQAIFKWFFLVVMQNKDTVGIF